MGFVYKKYELSETTQTAPLVRTLRELAIKRTVTYCGVTSIPSFADKQANKLKPTNFQINLRSGYTFNLSWEARNTYGRSPTKRSPGSFYVNTGQSPLGALSPRPPELCTVVKCAAGRGAQVVCWSDHLGWRQVWL